MLLKEETWREVLTLSKMNAFGLGCTLNQWYGKQIIQHNGGHTGFRTLHKHLLVEDFDIILLINSFSFDVRDALSEAIYVARYGLDNTENVYSKMDEGYIKETETPTGKARKLLKEIYSEFC